MEVRLQLDSLPHEGQDPVLTLHAHYFLAAELMRSNYVRLRSKWEQRGRLSQNETVNQRIYFCTWLGFLGVTCEGFKKLNMRILLQSNRPQDFLELIPQTDALGRAIKQHSGPLREFRNNVFHLRDDIGAIERFFARGAERLTWAEELQDAFDQFFFDYRILCEVHYVIHGRKGEGEMGRSRRKAPARSRKSDA